MSSLREHIVFSNPWSPRPAAGGDPSLPCLDDKCAFRFPDHDSRCEHCFVTHPYSRSKSLKKKPLQCRMCRQAYVRDTSLKYHIRSAHKPTSGDPPATQEDQETLIMQSHASLITKKRSAAQMDDEDLQEAWNMPSDTPRTAKDRYAAQIDDEDLQGHGVGRQDEGIQGPVDPALSRRTSSLQQRVMQYLKRKGS